MPISPRPPSATNTSSSPLPPRPAPRLFWLIGARLPPARSLRQFARRALTSPKVKLRSRPSAPATSSAPVVVEPGKAALRRPRAGVHGQRLADGTGALEPRLAHARETRAVVPDVEPVVHGLAPGSTTPRAAKAPSRGRERCRGRPEIVGRRDKVKPDADDGDDAGCRRARAALDQNAARLGRADENVVRPFEAQRRGDGRARPRRWRRSPRRRRRARAARPWRRGSRRRDEQARKQIARLRRPGAPRAAAARRLPVGDDPQRAASRPRARAASLRRWSSPTSARCDEAGRPPGRSAGVTFIGRQRWRSAASAPR